MKKIPVIFDCDPGIDDAFAMALLNAMEIFEIKGITAVYGNMPLIKTSYNALSLANTLEIMCPVCIGEKNPIYKKYDRFDDYVSPEHGTTGMGDMTFPIGDREFDSRQACDFIYETAKACGNLVIMAVGPLTNIAVALMRYPDLPKYIGGFYIMGGGINMGNQSAYAEANIFKDPTAAKICFEKLETHMVGLNATRAAALTKDDFDEMISVCSENAKSDFVKKILGYSSTNAFEKGRDSNVIHDALTVALAYDSSVCTLEKHHVYVEDYPYAQNDGETVIDDSIGEANTFVAVDTDNRKFKKLMLNMCEHYK